jgi:uncharacterized membrane protein YdbT with pleckstrin-like domain
MSLNLSDGEQLVFDLHPHWRQLVVPVLVLIVVCGLGAFGIAASPSGSLHAAVQWVIVAVGLVLIGWFTVLPYLRWVTTRYVLTSDRLLIRSGIVARHGRDVPLNRINDVSFAETLVERAFRSGTLVIESAGERGQIQLTDVPGVERVQREIYRMVEDRQTRDSGRIPPAQAPAAHDQSEPG